jgi:hypothetical protein
MDATDFLTAVLPRTGIYCICELTTKFRQHRYVDSVAAAVADAERFAAGGLNTYFALASFNQRGSREAINAHHMRSFFFDIDIDPAGKGGKYRSKKEAVIALHAFMEATGLATLGDPWLVDSGGGVHVYWPLSADVLIADWQPVAERLKRTAVAHQLHIDKAVTADAARVLRMPGTLNFKYDPPRPSAIKQTGYAFTLADIDSLLPTLEMLGALAPVNGRTLALTEPAINIPGTRPTLPGITIVNGIPGQRPVRTTTVGAALVPHIDSSFTQILDRSMAGNGCAQVRFYVEHADEDGMEPMWRSMLSLAKCTTEGLDAGRKLAAMHPYSEERLQAKWNALQGPYSCNKIEELNPGGCAGCPHAGKITNPLPLGYAYAPQVVPATSAAPALPAPPDEFTFANNHTSRVTHGEATVILPYVFFLHSVMQEGDSYCARFCRVVDADTLIFTAVPMHTLARKDDALKTLAGQNIFPVKGQDLNLFAYLRACVQAASVGNKSLRVPPKYGWQPDDSFAFGDRVVAATGEYSFISDRLGNLIEGMVPHGSMSTWQRIVAMLCAKGCYDIVSLMLIGFASPLMKWSNNGADAMVIHACGRESGVGKSLALGLARSVWGGKRFIVVPTTSENTMLQRAGLLGGLPLLVDEVTAKNRMSEMEWVPKFIFDYSQGQHKLKGSHSANAELSDNMMWNGLALITSNSPVLEHMLGARDTSSNGEVQRFLEWRCEVPINFSNTERDTLQLLNENYGHAGPQFATWLVNNLAVAKQVFATVMEGWRKQLDATDTERYWVAGGAAIITAAVLLGPQHANICTINAKRVMDFLQGLVLNTRRLITANVTDANDLIAAFLREHNGMFVKLSRAGQIVNALGNSTSTLTVTLPDSARGRVVGRIEYEVSPGLVNTYIDMTTLKKFCSLRNWSYVALKEDLSRYAIVSEKVMDLFKGTTMSSSSTRCLYLSYAISNAPGNTA